MASKKTIANTLVVPTSNELLVDLLVSEFNSVYFVHSKRYSFNSLSLPPSQPSRPSAIVRFKPCVRRELLHQLVVLLRNLLLMLAEAMLEDLNAEHDLEAELFVIIMITMIKGGGWW